MTLFVEVWLFLCDDCWKMVNDYRSLVDLNGWIEIRKALLDLAEIHDLLYVPSIVRRFEPVTLDHSS
jgi:hypothetical protein